MMRVLAIVLGITLLSAQTFAATQAQEVLALTALEVFQEAGIPIVEAVAYDAATDPNRLLGRPGEYVEKLSWRDERLLPSYPEDWGWPDISVDTGGSIERFANQRDLDRRLAYLAAFDGTIFGREYRYTHKLMILRLPFDLTPEQAGEYEAVFLSL